MNHIDDFLIGPTPEEIPFNESSDSDNEADLLKSAYELGFYGDGRTGTEGDLPVGLSVEMQGKWLASFRDGVRDERDEADTQEAIYREQASLYGDD